MNSWPMGQLATLPPAYRRSNTTTQLHSQFTCRAPNTNDVTSRSYWYMYVESRSPSTANLVVLSIRCKTQFLALHLCRKQ